MNERVGDRTGWFGTKTLSDNEYEDLYFTVAGYRDGVLKCDYDRATVASSNKIWHYADTLPGYSGCPVWFVNNYGQYYAVAINIAESLSYEANVAQKITTRLFKSMKDRGVLGDY